MRTKWSWWQWMAVGALGLMLAGCGGGGGSEPANLAPIANAGPNRAAMVGALVALDGSGSADPDGDTITYAWSLASAPAGSTAALVNATSASPGFTPDVDGPYVVSLVVSDGQSQSAPSTVTVTAALPQIVVDGVEPLSGSVKLSLSGTVTGPVAWYVDLGLLGNGLDSAGNPIVWNSALAANGPHLLVARIPLGGVRFQEARRTVEVSNSSIALSAEVWPLSPLTYVDARTDSPYGITSVSAVFDGTSLGTLAEPNHCSRFCVGTKDVYRFTVDALEAGSGPHAMLITAVDGSGASRRISVPVPISNAPVVTVTSPADGAFVVGTLQVTGTSVSDKPGAVTTTASLADVLFMQTTATDFSGRYDLAGVSPGSYTLTVRATDADQLTTLVQRTVVVPSNAGPAYVPAFTLPAGGRLLAAQGGDVLYAAGDGRFLRRDLGTGAEVALADAATIGSAQDWQLSGGRAYAFGRGADCTVNRVCVYQWLADGSITNLSLANPWAGTTYQQHPVAHDRYVIWTNDGPAGSYTMYDAVAQGYTKIAMPPGADAPGNTDYDFAVVGGTVHFYYWTTTIAAGKYDIYHWRSDTQASVRVTDGSSYSVYPQTDGQRVAWRQFDTTPDPPLRLVSQPLAGGASTTPSAAMSSFLLEDGVLAWVDSVAGSKAIRASAGSGAVVTLAHIDTAVLYAVGAGHVVYADQGKTWSWNAATGSTTLRIDAMPYAPIFVADGAMVFTIGRSVYRVPLN